jgi:hypothetical protein
VPEKTACTDDRNIIIPHLTGIVSISGGGKAFRLFQILKRLKNLKEMSEVERDCFLCTSRNGWIAKSPWTCYVLVFCHQISEYRLALYEDIHEEEMLLIVGGHKSA